MLRHGFEEGADYEPDQDRARFGPSTRAHQRERQFFFLFT